MLSKTSVKKPFTVIVGILIVLILGVVSYINTGIDLLPSMNLPYIVVVTINPGAAPEEVELTLTRPIEDGLSSVANIKSMSSTSSEHYSMVLLEFDYDVEVDKAYSEVKAALDLVAFPDDDLLQDPIVMKINPSMLPIMRVSISKDGETIKDSNTYLSNIIEQISGIDGVANINTNGLISNLAYININDDKIAGSLLDYLTELLSVELKLPTEIKEELRLGLAETVSLEDVTPEMLIESVVEILRDTQQWNEENDNDNIMKFAIDLIIMNLEDPNSMAYSIAIQRAEELISNKFILYDNEDSKRIFYDFTDQVIREALITFANSQISSLTEFISPDVLGQLLYAQDFDMPSGSIQQGALSYIVKIGTTVKNRNELINLPVVSFDLGAELETRITQLQNVLTLIAIATDGKATFTEGELNSLIDAIYDIYGASTDPDAVGIGFGTASAVTVWTAATLPDAALELLPQEWNGTFTDYLMENAPAAWNAGLTANWRVDALELFKQCFSLHLNQAALDEIDSMQSGLQITNIPSALAQSYVAVAELALPDTIKESLPEGWQAELEDIYVDEVDVDWIMPAYTPTSDLAKQLLYIFADNMPEEWQADLPADWETQIENAADASAIPTFTDIIRAAIGSLDTDVQDTIEELFRQRTREDISNFMRGSIGLLYIFSPDAVVIPNAVEGAIPDHGMYSIDFVLLKETIAELDSSAIIPLKLGSISDITFLDDSTKQITTLLKRINGELTPSDAVNFSIDKEPEKSTAEITKEVADYLSA
ncbi:MAG: efflux RND transporter permease subunit, partial [Clostridia bacterium]|nr:efflux RND transporter permease subunit [Clostridia bacterium]